MEAIVPPNHCHQPVDIISIFTSSGTVRKRTICTGLPLSFTPRPPIHPLLRLSEPCSERVCFFLAGCDSLLQSSHLLLLHVKVVRVFKLALHIVEQVLRIGLEVTVQLFGKTGELLESADGLAQDGDLLEYRVVCVV